MIRSFGWLAALVFLGLFSGAAWAQAQFVSAPHRTDMVHDARRGIIYIANMYEIRRYRVSTQRFLPPIPFDPDSRLMGIDLSEDGSRLAVADAAPSSTVRVYVVNLNTLVKTRHDFPREYGESSAYAVAYAADDALIITSNYSGSGWVPMRRMERDGTWSSLGSVRQNTMVSASGDGQTIAFAESNISDGRWGLYDIPTRRMVNRTGYDDGTSWFNFEIASDQLGSQFAIPTYNGAYIYGTEYQLLAKIGTYAGPQPVGVAYHPVENEIYFPWAGSTKVRVYSSVSLRVKRAIEIGDLFENTGNNAFVSGRTRLSDDGSLLMVTVPGGLRYVRMYEPLKADDVSATTSINTRVAVQLEGSLGRPGSLAYSIYRQPRHGTARVYGSRVSYTPAPGYKGTDSFIYLVRYGTSVETATARVVVK